MAAEPELVEIAPMPPEDAETVVSLPRHPMPTLPLEQRWQGYGEIELGLDREAAVREAQRCLMCGLGAEVITPKCIACLTCVRICPHHGPKPRGRTVEIDVVSCEACGLCASECPSRAIFMQTYDDAQFVAWMEERLNHAGAERAGPAIFAFRCRYAAETEPAITELGEGLKVMDLLCVGKVTPFYILKALELGADGVILAACQDGECVQPGGDKHTQARVAWIKELLKPSGMDSRVEMCRLPRGNSQRLIEVARAMQVEI